MHQQKLEYIPHRSELERNDSPQRSCTSLALGLPTSRGGWQGPGGTAGVWTCRVSDSLQGKTTHQLRPREKQIDNLIPLLSFRRQIVIFTSYQPDSGCKKTKKETHVNASFKVHRCIPYTASDKVRQIVWRGKK